MPLVYRIPARQRVALESLAGLDSEAFEALVAQLSELGTNGSRETLEGAVSEALPDIDSTDASSLIDAILGAFTSRFRTEDSAEDMFDTLTSSDQWPDLTDEERERLHSRLLSLYGTVGLFRVAKAIDVLVEQEHLYHGARSFVDVRSVFPDDAAIAPIGAVLMTTLRITFHEVNDVRSIYLALDMDDVRRLQVVLERAVTKAEALKQTVALTGLPLIEFEGR